ncbi:MAG: galactokinase [Gemmatimonadota bacterium]
MDDGAAERDAFLRRRLEADFTRAFGGRPTHYVRAPGRVNLLGEHTDYNDLPVLPMALQHSVHLALRPREDALLRVENLDPEFPPDEFEVDVSIPPREKGAWGNYVRAPAQELARRFAVWQGFDAVVGSTLPVAAGLSSSSALVNAVGLALATLGQVGLDPLGLAAVMADAERYTGTMGGGMDQAISLGARQGHAARIDFSPLRMRHILIPEDWRFIVADTGVRAEKSGAVQAAYNQRRAECRQALERVGAALVEEGRAEEQPESYPRLLTLVGGTRAALEVGEEALEGALLKRFRHVITEADRVGRAEDALLMANLSTFGMLMDGSQGSLRTDFLVSSAVLDRLVVTALEGGAAGARLTGAGFGGCIVALADAGTAPGVLEALRAWSVKHEEAAPPFVAVPSAGASFRSWD